MNFRATSLIYSSHNCCWDIHYNWIVKRALETGQQRILYLPMSEGTTSGGDEYERQQFGYSKFEWFLNRFKDQGLKPAPFYYSSSLSHDDAEVFFDMLANYEVVIFGGGNSPLGMHRYREMGARFFGNPNLCSEIVHSRQNRGLLTVGFSAGADHLAEYMSESAWGDAARGFGVTSRVAVTLHHESGREQTLIRGAARYRDTLWFGLPNDSGLASQQGNLPSGAWWQVLQAVLDTSWDVPSEAFHIKTRYGAKVDHYYADGRHWSLGDGDQVIRVSAPHGQYEGCWIQSGGVIYDYQSQAPTHFHSVGQILGSF